MTAGMRTIDQRFLPPVQGLDLEQVLNYINLADVTTRFIYECYTGARLTCVPGSRPALEKLARQAAGRAPHPLQAVQRLAACVAREVPWAGFYEKRKGKRLPADRDLTEEAIIRSGFGWCNEQARVFCGLTQVVGIVSRLVFVSNAAKHYGHVVCEALLPEGWMAVDESLGYCFAIRRKPVRAVDVYHDPRARAHFEPIYRTMCRDLTATLGEEIMRNSFAMALAPNPLDGFKDLGFHNHFVH